jgi:hypothetical protein
MSPLQQLGKRFESSWPTASLRTYLFVAIVLATLPLGALMSLHIYAELRNEQARVEHELARSAAMLSEAVDRELDSSVDALMALAM